MKVFGEVAELYDDARPGYPAALRDAIVGYVRRPPVHMVEVAAGTGKATELLEPIGNTLICLEPDERMAAVLSAKFPHVTVMKSTFEDVELPGDADLLWCALGWHWLGDDRNRRAHEALRDDGTLAVFGHRYGFQDKAQEDAVGAVFTTFGPAGDGRPEDWFLHDVAGSGYFEDVRSEVFTQRIDLPTERYLALVQTFGPFLKHPARTRAEILDALRRVVPDGVGVELSTRLVLGRPIRKRT